MRIFSQINAFNSIRSIRTQELLLSLWSLHTGHPLQRGELQVLFTDLDCCTTSEKAQLFYFLKWKKKQEKTLKCLTITLTTQSGLCSYMNENPWVNWQDTHLSFFFFFFSSLCLCFFFFFSDFSSSVSLLELSFFFFFFFSFLARKVLKIH